MVSTSGVLLTLGGIAAETVVKAQRPNLAVLTCIEVHFRADSFKNTKTFNRFGGLLPKTVPNRDREADQERSIGI